MSRPVPASLVRPLPGEEDVEEEEEEDEVGKREDGISRVGSFDSLQVS